jgi:hypothetical protein
MTSLLSILILHSSSNKAIPSFVTMGYHHAIHLTPPAAPQVRPSSLQDPFAPGFFEDDDS